MDQILDKVRIFHIFFLNLFYNHFQTSTTYDSGSDDEDEEFDARLAAKLKEQKMDGNEEEDDSDSSGPEEGPARPPQMNNGKIFRFFAAVKSLDFLSLKIFLIYFKQFCESTNYFLVIVFSFFIFFRSYI